MALMIKKVTVGWDGYMGATGYEIWVNNKKVATTGKTARTSNVSVPTETCKIQVRALPSKVTQEATLTQEDGTL